MSNDGTHSGLGDTKFVSALKEGHQRFLAHAIEHSFTCGRRTASDFIRHFPPKAIMKGLEQHPELRASILVLTTGLKHKIAIKKEWEDAATDLQIALEEGETDADSIVSLFNQDDRVRYLDPQSIWVFLTEGDFWKASPSNRQQIDLARGHIAYLLERALEDKLVTHRDVVEGVTVQELANRLPKIELGQLIQCALQNAQKGNSFTEVDLLATTPPQTLVQHVPLPHLWDTVIVPRIAQRHGYSRGTSLAAAPPASGVAASPAPVAAPAPAAVAAAAPAAPAEATKPVHDVPFPASAPGGALSKAAPAKSKDPAPAADSKVKLKQPEPAFNKVEESFFGDEADDIEVIEEETQKTG